jgi:hypothetical protein
MARNPWQRQSGRLKFHPIDRNRVRLYSSGVETNRKPWYRQFSKLLPSCFSLVVGLGAVDVWPSGCKKSFVALSPVAVLVQPDRVWSAAQYYASLRPNTTVVKGDGKGMLPLYAPGTVLVVEGANYNTLREGMSVMFRDDDQDGIRVVHFLLRRTPAGWATLGLNQGNQEDNEPLTEKNYLGVVIMAFSPETQPAATAALKPVPSAPGQ